MENVEPSILLQFGPPIDLVSSPQLFRSRIAVRTNELGHFGLHDWHRMYDCILACIQNDVKQAAVVIQAAAKLLWLLFFPVLHGSDIRVAISPNVSTFVVHCV